MNPAVVASVESLIRALNARKRPSSIDLGLGEPSLLPDVAHFERATAWVAEHGCRYSSNAGFDDVRELIARHYAYPGLDRAANVCLTSGSTEALYVTLKTLLDPAQDELLVVEPAFGLYAKIAEVEGIAVRRVTASAASGFRIDPDAILAAVGPRTRLIVICSPCNPTGRVLSRRDAARLSSGLLARGGAPVYVLHDEIYRELLYVDDAGSFGEVYPYTIAINSLSKSNALTGLRLGWTLAPADVAAQIAKMHALATTCASSFAQRVAFEIFAADQLGVQRTWYAEQRAGALAAAAAAGLELLEPDGAFYLCIRAGVSDTLAFAENLLESRDVVAIPGDIFGATLAGWLRTSFVAPPDVLFEGYSRIASLAAESR
ncbi:MAG: pyridoxal phosphate-dependent aminotransferase [Candidatus Baltobacteraceae bacterium]|jgi:aspartate/methionine/tyrosine aminotransferase